MNNPASTPIAIQRALENIRQEREIFEMNRKQAERSFLLRYSIGWISIVLITSIMAASIYILLFSSTFPKDVVTAAIIALFVDILGLAGTVWKIVLSPSFITKLETTTKL